MKTEFEKPHGWGPSQASRWEKSRSRGKHWYIAFNGGLYWGVGLTTVLNFVHYFILNDPKEVTYLLVSVFVYPLTGVILFSLLWRRNEKLYLEFEHKNAIKKK